MQTCGPHRVSLRPASLRRCGAALFAACLLAMSAVSAQEPSANLRLLAAARAGDGAAMARSLADGATPNARSRAGETALIIVLKGEHPDLALQMIDAGTDVKLAAANGVTPLMAAAHGGYAEVVRALLAKGADFQAEDRLQKTAMTYAAGQGHTDVVVLLLSAGIDPNAVYAHELTALMWAAGYGHTDTVKALLDAGARVDLRDDRGKSALDIAREGNFAATVKLLETAQRG